MAEGSLQETPAQDGHGTKLRILVIGGRRRAFSLEPEFWGVLEARASAHGQRLAHLVADILAREPEAGNATALLRLAALRWLHDERVRLQTAAGGALKRVISAVPSPAFSMDVAQNILSQNRAFTSLKAELAGADGESPVVLRLGAPLSRLHQALASQNDRAVSVPFQLEGRDSKIAGQLNMALALDQARKSIFLCIVRSVG